MTRRPDRFHALSVRDLLEAREAYHVHLAHKPNVFATAIGLYLIRDSDDDAKAPDGNATHKDEARTLANASARDWSWPCILVFVSKWEKREVFAEQPDTMVPRFLYLPDGRVVPTCVVQAEHSSLTAAATPKFTSDLLGGGYPCLADVQEIERVGSIGCLVTDGDAVYALTNRHVAGPAGREIYSRVAGARQRIGVSSGKEIGKRPFPEVYAGWQGSRVMVNLDAGLIRIDDVRRWTAQVYGVGEIGPVWDLDITNFNLDLIGCPLRAHGAGSGALRGAIRALFYRYKSIAGTDYVSDFLIGPRDSEASVGTLPGDSGTLWLEDNNGERGLNAPRCRPVAVQWGGQSLISGVDTEGSYALATCLATICRELDVDIIADWNTGHPETWGVVGHVKVGALACELVSDPWLHGVMMLNQSNIGVADLDLAGGDPQHPSDFAPLADVADLVWRTKRPNDSSNHFADMDEVAENGPFAGKSLLDLTKNDAHVDPDSWNQFYASIGAQKRGALPFRVWAIVDEMVDYAHKGKLLEFVCAAGLMAHYVGDACQPLHISRLHHGKPDAGGSHADVHSAYETAMLATNASALIATIDGLRTTAMPNVPVFVGGGQDAAKTVIRLMHRTVAALPPQTVIDVFEQSAGHNRSAKMWAKLGDRTAARILDGSVVLARIWEAAWKKGREGAAGNVATPTVAFSHASLSKLYFKKEFTPSYQLKNLSLVGDRLKSAP